MSNTCFPLAILLAAMLTLGAFAEETPAKETVSFELNFCKDSDFHQTTAFGMTEKKGEFLYGRVLVHFRCNPQEGTLYCSSDDGTEHEYRAENPGQSPLKFANVEYRTRDSQLRHVSDIYLVDDGYYVVDRSGWTGEVDLNGRRWRFFFSECQSVNIATFAVVPADWRPPDGMNKTFVRGGNEFGQYATYVLDGAVCIFEINKQPQTCEVKAIITHPPTGELLLEDKGVGYIIMPCLGSAETYTVPVFGNRALVPAGKYSNPTLLVYDNSWYQLSGRNRFVDITEGERTTLPARGKLHTTVTLERFNTTLTARLKVLDDAGAPSYAASTMLCAPPTCAVYQDGGLVDSGKFEFG